MYTKTVVFFGDSNGLIFANKNNSYLRCGGGKVKLKPCSPRRISYLLLCFKNTKCSDIMNSLDKILKMSKEVNWFSFAEKVE
jgi:hypothetical protein